VPKSRLTRPSTTLAAVVVVSVTVALSACTVDTGPGSTTSTTSTTTPVQVVPHVEQPAPVPEGTGSAGVLQQAFLQVVARVRPEVVEVATNTDLGSGIIFDHQGDIVTNDHVVGSATSFQVQSVTGEVLNAALVGAYPQGDIAVIRVSGSLNLAPATFADSAELQAGSIVFAVGSPLGLSSSVTEGIVSYNGRPVSEANGVNLPSTIQTSAAINPGNSGGALVDLDGDVVGIPTLAAIDSEDGGQAGGIGFAIPSDSVKPIAEQLIATGHVTNHGQAALEIDGSDGVDATGNPVGVVVGSVSSGSAVAKAGIVSGDVITSVAGHPTPDLAELEDVLAGLQSSATVTAQLVTPDGNRRTVTVVLGQLDD
jgi:S1-C subfamily serine protease